MKPLSPIVRRVALILFVLIWIALVPVVTQYASGWRYKPGVGLLQTGGIFVYSPVLDANVSVDRESVGSTSLLNRGLYIQDLLPSVYEVDVSKAGYRSWHRTVFVEPRIVTGVEAFLVPSEIAFVKLVASSTSATTTRQISSDTRQAYLAVFAVPLVASSTVPVASERSEAIFIAKGILSVRWLGNAPPPSAFCGRPSYCVKEIVMDRSGTVTRALFYRDGLVYRTKAGDIYYAEIGNHPDAVRVKLYGKPKADMSIINGQLVIKDGSVLYAVDNL